MGEIKKFTVVEATCTRRQPGVLTTTQNMSGSRASILRSLLRRNRKPRGISYSHEQAVVSVEYSAEDNKPLSATVCWIAGDASEGEMKTLADDVWRAVNLAAAS